MYEEAPAPGTVPTCAQAGVLGSLAGLVGALQASLLLELLAGGGRDVPGEAVLHVLDGALGRGRRVRVRQSPDCPGCVHPRAPVFSEESERCTR